ncbi:hypothetical protein L0U85_03940 [Glycomyces sp. L485]|uniref:hypothetical protein n=1 Tax=Glycomyces sp. L485 TaxID=2909235 RepID=UPI001F4ADAE5|nr:hypothetical protein [Glycomyces sp. L485]MCH7230014.1 hypothetical protein [Glycomyces sp. L485]
MTEHRNPSAAEARHGTLDVPLTVWQVADAASLTAGLFAEFKPARGPIVAVDVPGWETIPRHARHGIILTRNRRGATAVLKQLPTAKQGLVTIRPVSLTNLSWTLAAIEARIGLVVASAWLLEREGAFAAAANALKPDGLIALIARSHDEQARLTRLAAPPDIRDFSDDVPAALGMAYAGHIVAAAPKVFDAAVAAAEARTATRRSCPAAARHFDVFLWRKTDADQDGEADA